VRAQTWRIDASNAKWRLGAKALRREPARDTKRRCRFQKSKKTANGEFGNKCDADVPVVLVPKERTGSNQTDD
jgi:hypothetical protein